MNFEECLDDAVKFGDTQRTCFTKGYEAGQQARQTEINELKKSLETLLKSYKAQSGLPMSDEFNRGWVSVFACVHNDLKNLIK